MAEIPGVRLSNPKIEAPSRVPLFAEGVDGTLMVLRAATSCGVPYSRAVASRRPH